MKRLKGLILFLLLSILLGCWDSTQIEDIYLINSIGIDKTEEADKINVTLIAPTIHPEAVEPKADISSVGYSLRSAQDNIQSKAARIIKYTNTKLLILSEEIARSGISEHVDTLLRDPEGRGTMKIIVTEGMATELMRLIPPVYPLLSEYILKLVDQGYKTTTIPSTNLRSFNNDLKSEGIEPVMPYLKYGNKEYELLINSTAIFKNDTMIGILDNLDSANLMILRNEIHDGFFSFIYEDNTGSEGIVSLRKIKGRSNISLELIDSQLNIFHEIKITTHVSEYTLDGAIYDEEIIKKVEAAANDKLKRDCEALIKKLQKEYVCDNIGYGKYVKVYYPDIFLAEDWNKTFSNVVIHIIPDFKIEKVGTKI